MTKCGTFSMAEGSSMGVPISMVALLEGDIIEHARIEYKETWDPEASLKTICAFANDIDNWGGGYIVIGVRDDGERRSLVGVPAEKINVYQKSMLNACKLIRPSYMPIVDVVDHKGMHFIVIWAPGGSVRPYSAPKSMAKGSKERAYYIRKMASTIIPTEEELRDLYTLSNNVPFDDRPNHGAELADLNITLIKEYLREVNSSLYSDADSMPFTDLCRSMNIVDGPDEYLKPKNVGLMFFSPDPARFFPCAQIDVVEFPDGLGGQRIFERTFAGPLHHQLREALQYLRNSIVAEQVIKYPDRAEADRFFNYPYDALEEALANAVYHKGYDVREPIEVRILPDRIEILSYPGADRSISIEGLRTFRAISRRYRNRRVGDFLKELHLTEGRNTGMAKILCAMRQNGSPDPVFETDAERLYFLVTLPVHRGFLPDEAAGGWSQCVVGATKNRPVAGDGLSGVPCDQKVSSVGLADGGGIDAGGVDVPSAILRYFGANQSATLAEVAHDLGVSLSTVTRHVSSLKLSGLLRREGPSRGGRWIVG